MTRLDDAALRRVLDPVPAAWAHKPGLRPASVLAPIVRQLDEDFLLFTRRHDDLPHHAGQISFPGGAREGDERPVACALREVEEEIGVPTDAVRLLGGLPPRVSGAGFWVHVVVGRIPEGTAMRPQPSEVAEIVMFPVHALRDEGRWEVRVPELLPHRPASPHFAEGGHVLWGLTARLTLDLCARLP